MQFSLSLYRGLYRVAIGVCKDHIMLSFPSDLNGKEVLLRVPARSLRSRIPGRHTGGGGGGVKGSGFGV